MQEKIRSPEPGNPIVKGSLGRILLVSVAKDSDLISLASGKNVPLAFFLRYH